MLIANVWFAFMSGKLLKYTSEKKNNSFADDRQAQLSEIN